MDEEKARQYRSETYSQNQNFEEKSHILPKQPTTPIQHVI